MDSPVVRRKLLTSLLVMSPGIIFSGYVAARRAGIKVLYRSISFPEEQVRRDIAYRAGSTHPKHQLDLFLPRASNWPMLIFVHGGGLCSGDKRLRGGGADVYGNIARFYASAGIGVALVNYRLQPEVTWREQVEDVACAAAWVHEHVGLYEGNPGRLFIGGHSAGAYLAARIALDPKSLAQAGLAPAILSGVIAVSGAALDLRDALTYELGHHPKHYEQRFRCADPTDNWKTEASPITFAAAGAPPFLVIYPEGESKPLQRQSQLLHQTLREKGVRSELIVVPGEGHCRIVLALSRPDKPAAQAILRFIDTSEAKFVDPPLPTHDVRLTAT